MHMLLNCWFDVHLMKSDNLLLCAFGCFYVCDAGERERERERDSVRLGWQVSRRLLQASMLPFDTTGFVEQT